MNKLDGPCSMKLTFINAYETLCAKHERKREAERPNRKDAGTSEKNLKEVGECGLDSSGFR